MQTKKRNVLGGVLFFLMMLCVFGTGLFLPEAKKAEASPSEFRESVVMVVEGVRFLGTKSYREINYGSGFFVGTEGEDPMYLVTNHHVIEDYLELGRGKKRLLTDYQRYYDKARIEIFYDDKDSVEAYPVAYDDHADVAILRIEKATDKRKPMPIQVPDDGMVGKTVYACGFPGIAGNDEKDAVSQRSISDVSVTSGLISRLLTQHATGIREIQTDTDFWHGNSGGPLVLENGVAIGITANEIVQVKKEAGENVEEREELNYAVSMAEVVPLLKNNNIPYETEPFKKNDDGDDGEDGNTTSSEVTSSENGDTSGTVTSSETQSSTVSSSEETKEEGLSTTMIIVIAAAAAAVIVIILIIVLATKKKPSAESSLGGSVGSNAGMGNPVPQPMGNPSPMNMGMGSPSPMNMGAQPRPMDFNLSVQGVSGLFAGRTYTQGRDGRIMFGRQPSCQVVFGGNDKNVSGNHCVLFKQDGGVMLMDLGSTNGTFLENGTRLQANVAYALHAGERFYLVNKNYMFMIK